MSKNETDFLTRFSNADFGEWVVENKKRASSFSFEVISEPDENPLLRVLIPDKEDDGAYLDEYEETFEYDDVNDLIEDLLVANSKWTCERY